MTRNVFSTPAFATALVLSVTSAQAQDMSNADRQKVLENYLQADANDDTFLSRAEFETLMNLNAEDQIGRAAQLVKSGRYGLAFGRLDENGDGFISQGELQAMAQ